MFRSRLKIVKFNAYHLPLNSSKSSLRTISANYASSFRYRITKTGAWRTPLPVCVRGIRKKNFAGQGNTSRHSRGSTRIPNFVEFNFVKFKGVLDIRTLIIDSNTWLSFRITSVNIVTFTTPLKLYNILTRWIIQGLHYWYR